MSSRSSTMIIHSKQLYNSAGFSFTTIALRPVSRSQMSTLPHRPPRYWHHKHRLLNTRRRKTIPNDRSTIRMEPRMNTGNDVGGLKLSDWVTAGENAAYKRIKTINQYQSTHQSQLIRYLLANQSKAPGLPHNFFNKCCVWQTSAYLQHHHHHSHNHVVPHRLI